MKFEIQGNQFVKDGKPIKLISGAVHYFRLLPEMWEDVFLKAKALGLNCIETYTAWNMHERVQGQFDFSGRLDIAAFIRKAADYGFMVIVRPGPYICAEWEFGGLPWWIWTDDKMEIRCFNDAYIAAFDAYLDRLFEELRPLLSTNGGPIIMLQCENEYGSYGDDKTYLTYLRDGYRRRGMDVPLFTSDGHQEGRLLDGCIPDCLATLNFGSNPTRRFDVHNRLFPDSPKMCMEMWNGWFDEWEDDKHHTTDPDAYAATVSEMLQMGSVNMYMFIGGTNFGFMNGANHFDTYCPHVTSYDYDALLSECGDITPKYLAVREVLKQYADSPLPPLPPSREKRAYGALSFTEHADLFENLPAPRFDKVPHAMEHYGIGYGYILYETVLARDYTEVKLKFESVGDRASIYVGDRLQGIVYINDPEQFILLSAKKGEKLRILVENMGRTNFGSKMMRKKGLPGRVLLDGKIPFDWQVYPLPMENLSTLSFAPLAGHPRGFFRGSLTVDTPADTFLVTDNFTKGFVCVNGFNIGRFWEKGPQKTLYVPAALLKEGENEIILFESDGLKGSPTVQFVGAPNLGPVKEAL